MPKYEVVENDEGRGCWRVMEVGGNDFLLWSDWQKIMCDPTPEHVNDEVFEYLKFNSKAEAQDYVDSLNDQFPEE